MIFVYQDSYVQNISKGGIVNQAPLLMDGKSCLGSIDIIAI
jgi:hypothetical protein